MKKIFTAAFFLLLVQQGFAQVNLSNDGTLYISSSSDILYINGNLINNSTAALTNNGALYVLGNLTNNQASIVIGTGTLHLNGSAAQSIGGTQAFRTFNLNSNNSAGIILNNDLHISGTHTFTAGLISTSVTPNFLVYEAGSDYTGASDSRHVHGWVKKVGSTGFTFPIGNGTYLREIAISNLGALSEFNARHHTVTPNTNNLEDPIKIINPNEYWTLNRISGSTAQVTMNWDHSKIAFPNYILADIRTALYTTGWTNQGGSASGNTSSTGTITSGSMNSFGQMAIGSSSFVIPLDFLEVSAKRRYNTTFIEWKTANEVDVKHYEIQRGFTPTLFTTLGVVPARNLQTEQTYNLPDTSHAKGTVYYRIKSIDNSGAYKYSKIVALTLGNRISQPVLLTNPATTHLLLTAPEGHTVYNYRFSTNSGQLIQHGSLKKQGNLLSINLPGLAKGIYHLTLYYGEQIHYEKVLIQ